MGLVGGGRRCINRGVIGRHVHYRRWGRERSLDQIGGRRSIYFFSLLSLSRHLLHLHVFLIFPLICFLKSGLSELSFVFLFFVLCG